MPNTWQLKMTDSTSAEAIFVGIFQTISRSFSDNSTIGEEREAYALAKSYKPPPAPVAVGASAAHWRRPAELKSPSPLYEIRLEKFYSLAGSAARTCNINEFQRRLHWHVGC
jgi:hypothetical protein